MPVHEWLYCATILLVVIGAAVQNFYVLLVAALCVGLAYYLERRPL
jgi:hypothetical protein